TRSCLLSPMVNLPAGMRLTSKPTPPPRTGFRALSFSPALLGPPAASRAANAWITEPSVEPPGRENDPLHVAGRQRHGGAAERWRIVPRPAVGGKCALAAQPRPTNGIFVAITVRNSTFASSGRLAI